MSSDHSSPELIEAVQIDRDAAAARLERSVSHWRVHPARETAKMIRNGRLDGHEWVQEFARHRLASIEASGLDEVVEALTRVIAHIEIMGEHMPDLLESIGYTDEEGVIKEALEFVPEARAALAKVQKP